MKRVKGMISAAVVLFNTPLDLINRVINCYAPSKERHLYLIDNSQERLAEYQQTSWPDGVEYLFVGENQGYGKAHNIGIQKAISEKSRYHLVLNPDVHFLPDVPDQLADYADQHPDVVCMMPKVTYPNGEIQFLCKLLPTPLDLFCRRFLGGIPLLKAVGDRYTLKSFGYDKIINPPCLSGCFMFLRTDTLRQNDLAFDERFFLYCEDFDLVRRLHRYGKTLFYPEVTIAHDHARASYKDSKMLRMHMRSAFQYFNKYGWFFDAERVRMNQQILKEIRESEKKSQ